MSGIKFPKTTITKRSFKGIDNKQLLDCAATLDWEYLKCLTDVDDMVEHFSTNIGFLLDRFAPLKTISLKRPLLPWFNVEINNLIAIRDFAYLKWQLTGSLDDKEAHRVARNKCKVVSRKFKKNHVRSKLDPSLNSTRDLWHNISDLGIGKSKSGDCQNTFRPDEFNQHFSDNPTSSSRNDVLDTLPMSSDISDSFSLSNVTEEDVSIAVCSIKSDAKGIDGIPVSFLIRLLPIILSHLTYLMNACLTTSKFPSSWKQAIVLPLAKVNNPKTIKEFRPISILPSLSKILEFLVNKQIISFLNYHNLLTPFQSGFRPGHSCLSALMDVTEKARQGIDKGKCTILVLLDFTNAFGSVNFGILLNKLARNFKFSRSTLKFVHSYLSGRSQCVRVKDQCSSFMNMSQGVPQGSILGPLLFSLFINDIGRSLKSASFHMFADDFQFFVQCLPSDLHHAINLINNELASIYSWCELNLLKINPRKSQAIILYKSCIPTNKLPPILLNNTVIPFSCTVKNLGVMLACDLSWGKYVSEICRKIYGTLHILKRLSYFTPQKLRLQLVKVLIVPYITYCDCLYALSLDASSLRKLHVAVNVCTRYILNVKPRSHIPLANKDMILGMDLTYFLQFRCIKFIFKLLNPDKFKIPSYLTHLFPLANSKRGLSITQCHSNYKAFYDSFRLAGARLWNWLPFRLRARPSIGALQTHFSGL